MECHGIQWNAMECHGTPWNTMECHGIQWNINNNVARLSGKSDANNNDSVYHLVRGPRKAPAPLNLRMNTIVKNLENDRCVNLQHAGNPVNYRCAKLRIFLRFWGGSGPGLNLEWTCQKRAPLQQFCLWVVHNVNPYRT